MSSCLLYSFSILYNQFFTGLKQFFRYLFTMPYKQHRRCPLCESYTLNLSDHLSKVHDLSSKERQPYLQMVSEELMAQRNKRSAPDSGVQSPRETTYPEFCFKHPFSMLVVGPVQSGKNSFCGTDVNYPADDISR